MKKNEKLTSKSNFFILFDNFKSKIHFFHISRFSRFSKGRGRKLFFFGENINPWNKGKRRDGWVMEHQNKGGVRGGVPAHPASHQPTTLLVVPEVASPS